MQTSRLADF